ncbi:D-glucuronyl C5-epimerase family protein [Pseudomonas sp. KU43P]|uniref:D-glucuronyl C5-epimerase family protein n=1 Tax=Pseudomonas sp. KU43P TaxID=2487887 RepID=UPI0012AA7808|nr:D-glucuronyl C5-epimerase family protein [Pseudomonas sp. KU43P]BBH47467.1 hypothetical protein KU43P_39440 [Pseudomonas sp. KU43P]
MKIAFFLISMLAALGTAQASGKSLAAGSDAELAPYLWSWMDPVSFTEEGLKKTVAKKDPLRPFFLAFRLLTIYERTGDQKSLESAKRTLDYMLDEYQPAARNAEGIRWYYGFDYDKGIKAPWWSGMDGFFGPMTLFAGWQVTGDERYREAALKSAKLMLEDPTKGGVLWRDGGSCWISEYSWNGMTRDKEYHVLNGHLWGLQALYMLADASKDKELNEAYQCARAGTVERLHDYYNPAGNWTWYQLVPKVINPTHYNTIELAQFRAMALLTGDPVYDEPSKRRAEIFKNAYPLSLVKTKKGLEVQFSMMGAPNSYWTDTYPVTVSCSVGGKEVKATNAKVYSKDPLADRLILRLPVKAKPKACQVSIHSGVDVPIYEQKQFDVVQSTSNGDIPVAYTVALQAAVTDDGKILVTPASGENATAGEGRIVLNVDRDVLPSQTLALVMTSTEDAVLGLIVDDIKGHRASRYYPSLKAGKDHIVVLNMLGFDKGSELDKHISKLSLRVYTKPGASPLKVSIKELTVIRNTLDLADFMTRHADANFPQQ